MVTLESVGQELSTICLLKKVKSVIRKALCTLEHLDGFGFTEEKNEWLHLIE